MAAPTATLRLWIVGSYATRSTQTYGSEKTCIQRLTEIKKKLTIGAVPAQRIVRSNVLRPVGGTLHNLALDFVITSLVLKTCLPDCVPHSIHESRMKRAPRVHEELSLTGATCSEAGILPPVRSRWRREKKYFGTDLPNP
jgi:hypothetical protein